MSALNIKSATAADYAAAISTLTKAFSSDPVARWIFPDAEQYAKHFPGFVAAFAGKALGHGSAHCSTDCAGVALWMPPGIYPDESAVVTLLQQSVYECDQDDVFGLFQRMEKYHPAEPHWYLPMIGVGPAKQGKGYGSALLKHALVRCDSDNRLAYLESSNPQNIPLYERHGFEVLGTIQVGSSPPLFPMLRKPRGAQWVNDLSENTLSVCTTAARIPE